MNSFKLTSHSSTGHVKKVVLRNFTNNLHIYCNVFVMGGFVCLFVCVCQHDKTKTPDQNDMKLGTVM